MITWGHLCLAIYRAHAEEPGNPQVICTVQGGVKDATVFNPKTPTDVVSWLKNLHNEFHGGAERSFLEICEDILTVEAAWKSANHKTKDISQRGAQTPAGYNSIYWAWIQARLPCVPMLF